MDMHDGTQDDIGIDVSYETSGMHDVSDAFARSPDVRVEKLTVRVQGKCLLDDASVTLAHGRRYGLVGPNGTGKSTLLRLLARRCIPVPPHMDTLLVEQEVIGDDRTALQTVVDADVELHALRDQERKWTDALESLHTNANPQETTSDHETAHRNLAAVYERMHAIGAATVESRASKILHGLGFDAIMQQRSTRSFSGGWRMRISLARALFVRPTLLLLDEPTNHLDLRAVVWLETYLRRWKTTLVVVSHDREFLNGVVTDVVHLHDQTLTYYRGTFDQFEDAYEQKRKEVNKAFETYEKRWKAAKASGSKRKQRDVRDRVRHEHRRASRKSTHTQGAGRMDGEDVRVPKKWADYAVTFCFPDPTPLASPLVQLVDVSFAYPRRPDFSMVGLNLRVDANDRIVIVGSNGAGKSTLLDLFAGDLLPTRGEVRRNRKLRIGRYSQHFVDVLTMNDSPVTYLCQRFPETVQKPEQARAVLGKFGLVGHRHLQPIAHLSGGQKARVVFASIHLSQPHVLLLDEPTNHLDVESIDALAKALDAYQGAVVIVSHDVRLLSRVCEDDERAHVWIVERGSVLGYDGTFETYRDELVAEISQEQESQVAESSNPP